MKKILFSLLVLFCFGLALHVEAGPFQKNNTENQEATAKSSTASSESKKGGTNQGLAIDRCEKICEACTKQGCSCTMIADTKGGCSGATCEGCP